MFGYKILVRGNMFVREVVLLEVLVVSIKGVVKSNQEDVYVWSIVPNGNFLVKFAYDSLP